MINAAAISFFMEAPSSVPRLLVGDDLFRRHTIEGHSRQRLRIALGVAASADGADGAVEHNPVGNRQIAARLATGLLEPLFAGTVDPHRHLVPAPSEQKDQRGGRKPHST
jgi:hypothetical protein